MSDRLALAAEIKRLVDELAAAPAAPIAPAPPAAPSAIFGDEGAFYDWLRGNDMLGPVISADEFKGTNAIVQACASARYPIAWTADALGTAYLETANTMLPVKEAFWLSASAQAAYFRRMYDIQGQRPAKARELGNLSPGDGAKYPGRGYVQLTGKSNYEKAGAALGVDLIGNPELALRPDIAAAIMTLGMAGRGLTFTGKKLADYLPASGKAGREDFKDSRRIINGTDRDDDLAGFCINFQEALAAGRYLIGA